MLRVMRLRSGRYLRAGSANVDGASQFSANGSATPYPFDGRRLLRSPARPARRRAERHRTSPDSQRAVLRSGATHESTMGTGAAVSHRCTLRTRLLLIAFGVAACAKDSAGPPPPPPPPPPPQKTIGPAAGSWFTNGPDFIMTLSLSDSVLVATGVGTIAGIGSVTGPNITGGTIPFSAAGKDSAGSVRLTFTASGLASPVFAGQLLPDSTMQGDLDGA